MRKREEVSTPTSQMLLRAFGRTPDAFHRGIDDTLHRLVQGKEKPIMKKKMRIIPAVALILVALLAVTAVAVMLYPGTIERFTQAYGEAFGKRLAQGDSAQVDASYTLGDVTYTVNDVVYAEGVLYGTVVMQPAPGANVVLLPEEYDVNDLIGSEMGMGVPAPEGAKSFKQTAQEQGAKIVFAKCLPDGYILDGELLTGDIGYMASSLPDGSVITSFEMYGWNGGIERRDNYMLCMNPHNWEVTLQGEWLREEPNNTWLKAQWNVEVSPQMKPDAPAQTPVPVTAQDMAVVTPDGFAGELPVYAVTTRSMREIVQPQWITASGIAAQSSDEWHDEYTFEDESQLSVDDESIRFDTYEGFYTRSEEDGTTFAYPADSLDEHISGLALDVYFNAQDAWPQATPEPIVLSALTLEEADEQAQAILSRLGVGKTHLTWAYAMDVSRINALNDARNAEIHEGIRMEQMRHVQASTQDEGYLLVYRVEIDGVAADDRTMNASFFVNSRGIRRMYLYAPFELGKAQGAPQKLIAAEDALAYAVDAAKKSWIAELAPYLEDAAQAEIIYTARDKSHMQPAWKITAFDEEKRGYPFTVIVSATDGAVIRAPWM